MTFHEYLAKARQHAAQQAGQRDRLLRQARQARTARRHHTGPAARARRLAQLLFRRAPGRVTATQGPTPPGSAQPNACSRPAGPPAAPSGGCAAPPARPGGTSARRAPMQVSASPPSIRQLHGRPDQAPYPTQATTRNGDNSDERQRH